MKTVRFTAAADGVGLFRGSTGCRESWGHGGNRPGYLTAVYASDGGTRVVVMAMNGASNAAFGALVRAAADVFCGR